MGEGPGGRCIIIDATDPNIEAIRGINRQARLQAPAVDVVASGRLLPSAETVVSYSNTVIRPGTDSRHAALQEQSIGARPGFSRSRIFVPENAAGNSSRLQRLVGHCLCLNSVSFCGGICGWKPRSNANESAGTPIRIPHCTECPLPTPPTHISTLPSPVTGADTNTHTQTMKYSAG